MRVVRLDDLPSGEVSSDGTGDVADPVEGAPRNPPRVVGVLHRGLCTGAAGGVGFLKVAVVHGQQGLGVSVQFRQTAYLELVDLDAVGVGPQVEADGDELDDDLFDEVQGKAHEDGDDDLVDDDLPLLRPFRAVDMVVGHGREKRNLNGQPPEEQRSRELQLLGHVPPLLLVVGEEAGDDADRRGDAFRDDAAGPEGQPEDLQPDGEPGELDAAYVGVWIRERADQKRDEKDEHSGRDVGEVADEEARVVDFDEELCKGGGRVLDGLVLCGLLVQRVRRDVELVDGLAGVS